MTDLPLSLPTSPDRAAILAAARGTPPYYDERLKLWVVLDHEKVAELMQDERLFVPEVAEGIATLERRYGGQFPNLKWLARELPLILNGADHKRTRAGLARLLSVEKKTGSAWREPVTQLIASAFGKTGRIEAVGQLLLPIINAVFAALTHIDLSFEPLALTRIFDHYASYRHLIALERDIGILRDRLRKAGLPEATVGAHAGLVVLGRDSLLSSLAEGFIDFALGCQGRRLDDASVRSPRLFGGVAIGERLATEPFNFAGVDFKKGDRIRLYLQGFGQLEREVDRLSMFGAGEHSCIGRALAMEVWSLFASEIRKVPFTLRSVEFEYERHSIFVMPRFIKLEVVP